MLKFRRLLYLLFVLTGCAHATELLRDLEDFDRTFDRVYGANGVDTCLRSGHLLPGAREVNEKAIDLLSKYPEFSESPYVKTSFHRVIDRMKELGSIRTAEEEEFMRAIADNPALFRNSEVVSLLKSNDNSIKNDIALRKLVLPHKPAPIAPEIDFFQSWNRDTKHAFPKMDSLLETHPKKTVFSKKKVSKSKKSKSSVKASASKRRKTKRSRSRGKKWSFTAKSH